MVFNICRGNTVDEDDATNELPSSVEIDPVRKTSREKKATRREKKKKKSSRSSTLLKPFQNPLHNFFHKPSEKNHAAAAAAGTNPNPSSPNRSPSSSPVLSESAAAAAARSSSSSKKKKGRHSGRAGARKQFLKATVEGIGNVAIFDNLQSLPDLDTAFDNFKEVYVRYDETEEVDHLRAEEYYHFAERDHVCLDYSGFGLFSQSQQFTEQASSSSFGLAYVSANLLVHTLYGMAAEGTLEFDIQRRIMKYMNISESDYIMVFTTSRSSAYKILAESYPFGTYSRLLTVYDYQSEAMSLMVASAKQRGAKTLTANFKWPSLQISARDLRYKLQDRRHRKEPRRKGLFVFPVQSRVTGAKYSYQWMSQAQANDWNVLLDASALGPKDMDSLGLSLFRPEFIVTSFYKVFGADPTGFGCLFIKKSAIQSLQNSTQPRGVGIVRIVPNPENPQHAPTERSRESKSKIVSEIQEEGEEGEDDGDEFYLDAHAVNQVRSFSGPVSELYLQDDQTFVSHKAASSSRKEKEIAGFGDEAVDVNKFAPFRKDMGTRAVGLQEDQIPKVLAEVGEGSRRDTEAAGPADFLEDKRPKFQTDHDAMPYEAGNGKAVKAEYEIGTEEMMELNQAELVDLKSNRIRRDDPDIRILEGRESGQFLQQQKLFGLGPEESSGQFTYDDGIDERHFQYWSPGEGSSQWVDQYPISAYGSPIYYEDDETFTGVSASDGSDQLVCRGLDHADSQGLNKTNLRLRYLINWLVISLLKLCHPSQGEEEGSPLVHIYGPEVKYDRGGSVAFNIFDRTGALVNPGLVQRLADRHNISLGLGTLCNIVYPDRPIHLLDSGVLEPGFNLDSNMEGKSGNDEQDWPLRIPVVTAALGFVSNFEDVYRLWTFVAQFLDADFVSREGWRYYSLNQEMVF